MRGRWLVGLLVTLLGGCGVGGGGKLAVSGTIEADDVRVSSLVGGIVAEVLVDEGERIEVGTVVLRFDPADIELQAQQARAVLSMALAQLDLAHAGARPEDIAAARELTRQAETAEEAARADLERADSLESSGGVTAKQADDARARYDVSGSQTRAAKQQYNKALRGARPEEVKMAEAGVEQAEAAVALAEKKLADCEVLAPLTGTVVHRLVSAGEVVGPGATLFVVQDLDTVRLTVFVPEVDVGAVRLGDPVAVSIDSMPDRIFPGQVSRIRDEAEFTPKNVQTKDERVKLVFGVEVELANPEGYLKPGLPADAVIGSTTTVAEVG